MRTQNSARSMCMILLCMRSCEVAQCLWHSHLCLPQIWFDAHVLVGSVLVPLAKEVNRLIESFHFAPSAPRSLCRRRQTSLTAAHLAWYYTRKLRAKAKALVEHLSLLISRRQVPAFRRYVGRCGMW